MCSDFDKVSFLSMSNSDMFVIKDTKGEEEFDILKKPILEVQEDFQAASTPSRNLEQKLQQEEARGEENEDDEKIEEENTCKFEDSLNDDDEGFKTPTSLDHQRPGIKQCPPAPRKPKPRQTMKRKASPPNVNASLQLLDLTEDVESLFPRAILADLHQKMKKARRDHNNDQTSSATE